MEVFYKSHVFVSTLSSSSFIYLRASTQDMPFVKGGTVALLVAAGCLAVVGVSGNSANTTTSTNSTTSVNSTTCNGKSYVYQELAGYGFLESNAVDKYNDTIGGIGSSIAIDLNTWTHRGGSYHGILWALPGTMVFLLTDLASC